MGKQITIKLSSVIFLSSVLFFASGCNQMSIREQMTVAGYEPSYIDGYTDGHSSGYVAAGHPYYKFLKNTRRYESDSQYKQGWEDGFRVSKGQYESIQRMMN
jgi:hypothetical protein